MPAARDSALVRLLLETGIHLHECASLTRGNLKLQITYGTLQGWDGDLAHTAPAPDWSSVTSGARSLSWPALIDDANG
jgi:hypothetical protein